MRRTVGPRVVAVSALVLAAVVGCDNGDSDDDLTATPTEGQLILAFDGGELENSGSGDFQIEVVTMDGGEVEGEESPDGDGLRTPDFADSPESPKAIVKVLNGSDDDQLNPGTKDFTIGADVSVDPDSESDDPANGDNGNNVMQRGLFEGSQYKIQIDHDTASCRIAGADGEITAKSSADIAFDHWYRVRCERDGDEVTISVIDLEADDPDAIEDEESGPTGSLDPPAASLPLSVGGKLNADGGIVEDSTDQFNGLIDNVVLNID